MRHSAKRHSVPVKKTARCSSIEPLEARIAPAVTAAITAGVLTISSNAANDVISLQAVSATQMSVSGTGLAATTFTDSLFTSITVTSGGTGVVATVHFSATGDPDGGHPLSFTGGFAGDQLAVAGSTVENVVWAPSSTVSNAGSSHRRVLMC